MSVFTEAPKAQVSTYTNGAKILRALIAGEKMQLSKNNTSMN